MAFLLKNQRQPDGGGNAGAEAVVLERNDQVDEQLKVVRRGDPHTDRGVERVVVVLIADVTAADRALIG